MKTKRTLLFFSVVLSVTTTVYADTEQTPQSAVAKSSQPDMIKSANDQRDYAYAKLKNGLKLLVISDKEAQRAAAAVDVKAGSANEPDTYPGLAHFLEHMLFLGTDQYPSPDDFMDYITAHGGSNNAYTGFDQTNYHFSIDPKYLHGALKRFARFFVAPLMDEKYVTREREAVNSEYQAKISEPFWRDADVFKHAINPQHPYARFNVGSLETLPADTVRPALLEFYKKYYSADRMSVVIIGNESTDTLLKWGRALFAEVPQRDNAGDIDIKETLFGGKTLPILIKNTSLQSDKTLRLNFEIPYETQDKYVQVSAFLSHNLAYEGQDGLVDTLKSLGYISSLIAGELQVLGHEMTFSIIARLTDKGYQNTDKVLAVIFDYINLLRADKGGKERYDEIATIAKTDFQFSEKGRAIDEASELAKRLNMYPVRDVLAIDSIYKGYETATMDKYLSAMTPEAAIVQLTAPDIESEQQTYYFNVPYSIEALDPKAISTLSKAEKEAVKGMHVPSSNPFIADDYSLQSAKIKSKNETLDNGIELYYKHDTSFDVPRSSVQISLQPTAKLSMTETTAMVLLSKLLTEQLTGALYDASVAGLNADIGTGNIALTVSLKGYQQKMPELLTAILAQLQNLSLDKITFERVKTTYRQNLQNFARKMPYEQTLYYLNKEIVQHMSLPDERLAVLDAIDEKNVMAVKDKILASLAVRMMVYGNNNYAQAKTLAETIASHLPKTELHNQWQKNSAIVLAENLDVSFTVPHEDNTVSYYIQSGKGYKARAELGLLGKLIEAPFYNDLRTEKQLGYIVFAYPKVSYDRAGFGFTVESPVATADELEKHILNFNDTFAKSLAELSEEEFAETKSIFKTELLQAPESLMAAAKRYWTDILTTGETASSRKALAKAVDEIELKAFVTSMQAMFKDGKHVSIKALPDVKADSKAAK